MDLNNNYKKIPSSNSQVFATAAMFNLTTDEAIKYTRETINLLANFLVANSQDKIFENLQKYAPDNLSWLWAFIDFDGDIDLNKIKTQNILQPLEINVNKFYSLNNYALTNEDVEKLNEAYFSAPLVKFTLRENNSLYAPISIADIFVQIDYVTKIASEKSIVSYLAVPLFVQYFPRFGKYVKDQLKECFTPRLLGSNLMIVGYVDDLIKSLVFSRYNLIEYKQKLLSRIDLPTYISILISSQNTTTTTTNEQSRWNLKTLPTIQAGSPSSSSSPSTILSPFNNNNNNKTNVFNFTDVKQHLSDYCGSNDTKYHNIDDLFTPGSTASNLLSPNKIVNTQTPKTPNNLLRYVNNGNNNNTSDNIFESDYDDVWSTGLNANTTTPSISSALLTPSALASTIGTTSSINATTFNYPNSPLLAKSPNIIQQMKQQQQQQNFSSSAASTVTPISSSLKTDQFFNNENMLPNFNDYSVRYDEQNANINALLKHSALISSPLGVRINKLNAFFQQQQALNNLSNITSQLSSLNNFNKQNFKQANKNLNYNQNINEFYFQSLQRSRHNSSIDTTSFLSSEYNNQSELVSPNKINTKNTNNGYSAEDQRKFWIGQLPPKTYPLNGIYSRKVFIGGLPWDCDHQYLLELLKKYGGVRLEIPGKDQKHPRVSNINKTHERSTPGYIYVIYDNETAVQSMLADCRKSYKNGGEHYFYTITIPPVQGYGNKRAKQKEVEVIPWNQDDTSYVPLKNIETLPPKIDSKSTIFVGALHGMLNAQGLAIVMSDLFGDVIHAGLDTDKYKYPIGSGRVTFRNRASYIEAIKSQYVTISANMKETNPSPKFEKTIQIDPYLEDAKCCSCDVKSLYFCRNENCLDYFCHDCWILHHRHCDDTSEHKALSRQNKPSCG